MTTVRWRADLAAFLQTAVAEYLELEVRETGDLTGFFAGGRAVEQLTQEVGRYGYNVTRRFVGGGVQNYAWMGDQSHHAHISLVRIPRMRSPPPRPATPAGVDGGPFVYAAQYHDPVVDNSTWLTVSGPSRDEALAKAIRRSPDGRLPASLHREDDQIDPVWENGSWLPLAFEPHTWTTSSTGLATVRSPSASTSITRAGWGRSCRRSARRTPSVPRAMIVRSWSSIPTPPCPAKPTAFASHNDSADQSDV